VAHTRAQSAQQRDTVRVRGKAASLSKRKGQRSPLRPLPASTRPPHRRRASRSILCACLLSVWARELQTLMNCQVKQPSSQKKWPANRPIARRETPSLITVPRNASSPGSPEAASSSRPSARSARHSAAEFWAALRDCRLVPQADILMVHPDQCGALGLPS